MVIGKEINSVLTKYEGEQKIELAEHLLKTFDELLEYFKTKEEEVYQRYVSREKDLLKKYGKSYKAYAGLSIYKLFDFDMLLAEKDYYTLKEFNSLKAGEGDLSEKDVKEWCDSIKRMLYGAIHFSYLEKEPEFETITFSKDSIDSVKDDLDKEITEARQLLAIYYLLKSGFNIEHRGTSSVSEVARFAHLLTGTKFTTLQKSNIYKKYQLIPNYNKEEYLIKDLRFIKPYFEALNIQKAVELIDKEIETSIKELPLSRRKIFL
ncbi:MAG: hypothetical protein IT215_02310 [Chitinophagaceae bacterium]|nr:hypothetical protein [Chitinophagaceae bacterium]